MSSGDSLPDELWKVILRLVPLRERLCVCTVSKQLQRAAVAATTQLEARPGRFSDEETDRLWQWLDHHGQHITTLVVSVMTPGSSVVSRLPCQNLRQLQLAHCSVQLGPSSSHPGVLQVCTALTKLLLSDCELVGGRTSLAVLSVVPALQHLHLDEVELCTRLDLPAAVLGCLQQLTHLHVSWTNVCIQHISCLKKLQRLSLEATADVTPSTTPGLDQLTALQDLDLREIALDPAALHGCTTLRRLSLHSANIASNSDGPQSLLSFIVRQQQLQQLVLNFLYDFDWPPTPSAYTALTASSLLQQLQLVYCPLPAGAWQQGVFSPKQQLPQLRSFTYDKHATATAPPPFSQQDVLALVSRCPTLQALNITLQPGVQLTGLVQLTDLEHLDITGADATTCRSLSALSNLRRLCSLTIVRTSFTTASLLQLTLLQQLTTLTARCGVEVQLRNKGPASEPDVWMQLAEHCQAQQQQQQ